ncbi:type II secretion system protein [Deferribacter autotrophicus]|uniref:Type II secretion system protein n=1 Tax=Deferribacter autotrophicus TaxID=500465 RepID=A0A5A8F0H3_9BACT|nr:type II secretion system protein [Deferribacter autotrophicus]KAA0257358.1 type II secretion system protein [Deferribacter autotrophicus]
MEKKGFTLVELVIVIVLLGIISTLGINLLLPIFTGYTDAKIKDILYNEAKFLAERMEREMKYAIPNTFADLNGDCTFSDSDYIKYATFRDINYYEKISKDTIKLIDNGTLHVNDNITIYVTRCNQYYDGIRVYEVIDNTTNYQLNKNIKKDSPYERLFLINEDRIYKLIGTTLYWCKNDDNNCYPFGNYIKSLSFTYNPGSRWSNARIDIKMVLEKSDVSITYNHSVHVRNVP